MNKTIATVTYFLLAVSSQSFASTSSDSADLLHKKVILSVGECHSHERTVSRLNQHQQGQELETGREMVYQVDSQVCYVPRTLTARILSAMGMGSTPVIAKDAGAEYFTEKDCEKARIQLLKSAETSKKLGNDTACKSL